MKLLFIFLLNAFFVVTSLSAKTTHVKCAVADKVSREFTLAAQNKGLLGAKPYLETGKKLFTNGEKLETYFERQFRSLSGIKVFHSVPSKGPEFEKCSLTDKGEGYYRDHRLLLAPSGKKGDFKILPISVHLKYFPKTGWKVVRFASTAF